MHVCDLTLERLVTTGRGASAAGREGAHPDQPARHPVLRPAGGQATLASPESSQQLDRNPLHIHSRWHVTAAPHLPLSEEIIVKLASSLLWMRSENKDHFNLKKKNSTLLSL